MAINKGEHFSRQDVYIDYPYEEVMYRWDHKAEKIYVKFYGEEEKVDTVPYDNRLFTDALLSVQEISKEVYLKGKQLSNLGKAIEIATKAHAGQLDKAGQPYILHPLRLMFRFDTEVEMITAVMHDVVEDSDISLGELESQGFQEKQLEPLIV